MNIKLTNRKRLRGAVFYSQRKNVLLYRERYYQELAGDAGKSKKHSQII
jgi:hypothetical protein